MACGTVWVTGHKVVESGLYLESTYIFGSICRVVVLSLLSDCIKATRVKAQDAEAGGPLEVRNLHQTGQNCVTLI